MTCTLLFVLLFVVGCESEAPPNPTINNQITWGEKDQESFIKELDELLADSRDTNGAAPKPADSPRETVAPKAAGAFIMHGSANFPPLKRARKITPYRIHLQGKTLRFDDLSHGFRTLVDIEKERSLTIDLEQKTYIVETFDTWRAQQKKRLANEKKTRRAIIDRFPKGSREWSLYLREKGLSRDGKNRAWTLPTDKTKTIAGYPCTHIKIARNYRTNVVFDMWVTDQLPKFSGWVELFESMGLSPKVLDELRKVKGFPLTFKAILRGERGSVTVRMEATKIDLLKKLKPSVFALGKGYTKQSPDEKPPEPTLRTCDLKECTLQFKPKDGIREVLPGNLRAYFCTPEHRDEFLDWWLEQQKKSKKPR